MLSRFFLTILCLVFLSAAYAQDPFEGLLEKTLQKNAEYSAILREKEAAQAQLKSTYSAFYPTLEAVGGWEDRNEELEPAKGYVGFARGRLNLFNGFKDQAGQSRVKAELASKEADLEIKKREIRSSLRQAVSEMLYLHGLQNILKEEIKVAQTQKQMASKKVAAGLTSSVDNIEFDLRTDELEIQKRRIDQMHIETHQSIFKLLGEDLSEEEINQVKFRSIAEFKSVLSKARIENNPFLRKASAELERSKAERVEARSEFIPKLDFEYSFGRITPSEESRLRYNESRVGVFLTIPLFSGFETHYKVRAAAKNFAAKESQNTQAGLNIQSEFAVLKAKIQETLDLFEINERKRTSAKKYFEMTLGEYRRGIKNSPDLVGATERMFESEKQHYEIQKDLEILTTKLESLI